MPAIVDHGIPVTSSRQWVTALSPNPAGNGWNYIVCSWPGGTDPLEWVVLNDLTTAPAPAIYETLSGFYPNTLFGYGSNIRAPNGRIFFPLFRLYTAYYDPTTEQIQVIGPVVETPPINPNASTAFYSASFDVAGLLYFATQESQNRPSCVVVTDPTTLAQTILGYVGDGALSYTTFGYYIAPDTVTATKFVYVAYGQNPWQLWALNITPGPSFGTATKLYEVTATGNISFSNISGQGWVATIHTNLGQPDNVTTKWWCLDGAIYAYTQGQPPPSGAPATRNVTPASNPLASGAPLLDLAGGIGVVGWRALASDPYTYVNYSVNYTAPKPIESLVASNDGLVGNAEQYFGVFQYDEDDDSVTWYGSWPGGPSRGPRLNVDGTVYFAGYPNGVMYSYDPDAAWASGTNPTLLGYVGQGGTQYAGIKYSDFMAWAPLAGSQGRLYVAGSRERNGVGSGIGSWDKATGTFAGTYSATGMSSVLPDGVCVLGSLSRVVMSTRLITPPGTANLYVFDYSFNLIATLPVIVGLASLGPIFETTTPNVITGIVQGSGNQLGLWQYNVATQTFIQYVELAVVGTLGAYCQRPGGSVWIMSGNNLVNVDITNLTADVIQDLTSIAPVEVMGFASDASALFLAGGVNETIEGAQLFSLNFDPTLAAGAGGGAGVGNDAVLDANGAIFMLANSGAGLGLGQPAELAYTVETGADTGENLILLANNESTTILRGQPVFSDIESGVRLAVADGTPSARVVGIVAAASIAAGGADSVALDGVVTATPDEWDAVCGTTGGLTFNTIYFLHPSVPGRLTSVPPTASGKQVVIVIRGISPTQGVIEISPPVLL